MALIICKECSKEVSDQALYCPNCGAPITFKPTKNRLVAALLAIFLGGIGIHKFYLDQKFWGIIYLLFCWTFIPAIIGFLEGIVYLLNSEKSFQKTWGGMK